MQTALQGNPALEHVGQLAVGKGQFIQIHDPKVLSSSALSVTLSFTNSSANSRMDFVGFNSAAPFLRIRALTSSSNAAHSNNGVRSL